MSHTQYKVTAPVSFADVQAVLGVSTTDLATLCKSEKINKWAKNKPFSAPIIGVATFAQKQANFFGLNAPVQAGTTGTYFNRIAWDCMRDVVQSSVNKGGLWGYAKPTGGVYSPYRLTDFDGYSSMNDMPVTFSVSTASGITSKGTHEYEVATQTTKTVQIVMSSIPVADIILWELLQMPAYNTSYSVPWRIRCEIYGTVGWETANPMKTFVSDPLTWSSATDRISKSVTLNFEGMNMGQYIAIVGFQRCDANGNAMQPNGILPPWTDNNKSSGQWPFYWKFNLANYNTRSIIFAKNGSTLGFSTSSWFTIENGTYYKGQWRSGQLFAVCTISLGAAMYFVGQNGGGSGTRIQFGFKCPQAHGDTIYYATPSTSSRGTASGGYIYISSGTSSQTQTLYMLVDENIRPSELGYYSINVLTRTFTTSTPSGTWVDATSLTLHIT